MLYYVIHSYREITGSNPVGVAFQTKYFLDSKKSLLWKLRGFVYFLRYISRYISFFTFLFTQIGPMSVLRRLQMFRHLFSNLLQAQVHFAILLPFLGRHFEARFVRTMAQLVGLYFQHFEFLQECMVRHGCYTSIPTVFKLLFFSANKKK